MNTSAIYLPQEKGGIWEYDGVYEGKNIYLMFLYLVMFSYAPHPPSSSCFGRNSYTNILRDEILLQYTVYLQQLVQSSS